MASHAAYLQGFDARDDGQYSNVLLIIGGHEHPADVPVSAWQHWLLFYGESLASKQVARGDEQADQGCEGTN
jgi:hypothetical protein